MWVDECVYESEFHHVVTAVTDVGNGNDDAVNDGDEDDVLWLWLLVDVNNESCFS